MNSKYLKSAINYSNAKYFGVDLVNLYKESGDKISKDLIKRFGKHKSFLIICGTAGNGGDGFTIAMDLVKNHAKDIIVYLVGRLANISDPAVKKLWLELNDFAKSTSDLTIKQDAYAKDIDQKDIVIECISGTGFEGEKLNKRSGDIIKRISHFDSRLVAIDVPVPSYTPDIVYSLMYPKTEKAVTIDVKLPKELGLYCGPGDAKYLFEPKLFSHKKKNGKLLYISNTASNEDILMAAKLAEQYNVQLSVYNPFNLAESNESKNIEMVQNEYLDKAISSADSIIFGNFDELSLLNRALINEVLKYKAKRYIFSSSAINFFNIEDLKQIEDSIVILNKNESIQSRGQNVSDKRLAVEYSVNVASIGMQTVVYNTEGELRFNVSPLSAKSFYKPLLANLIAVLSTKNDFWQSMKASMFLLDLSAKLANGDSVEVNQDNIINRIVKSLEWCSNF